MRSDRLLVDTNIIIHVFEGHPRVVDHLDGHSLAISVLTRMELHAVPAITPARAEWVDAFVSHCELVPLLRAVQDQAARLRRTYRIEMVDAIILASALVKGIPFLTADKRLARVSDELEVRLFTP